MPGYIVNPYDVLFFRGNKSFSFGEWYTEGIFPPYPSTFQGFVRSKILQDNNEINSSGALINSERAKKLVGDDTEINVNITGPYLIDTKSNNIYFKTPSDLFENDKTNNFDSACIINDGVLESDLGFELKQINFPFEKDKKIDKFCPPEFISLNEIINYRMSVTNVKINSEPLTCDEARVVINVDVKDETRAARDGRFCITQYKRFRNDIGFYCNVDKEINNGALKLGSESHLVYIQKISDDNILETRLKESRNDLTAKILETKKFRMILLSHGIFRNGWIPFDKNEKKIFITPKGLEIELLFAFVGAPIKISGYSFRNSKADDQKAIKLKSIVNAVPSGAVYLFQIKNGSDEAIKKFVNKYDNSQGIEFSPYSYHKMGFNHTILGVG
ncbi:MAG: hypothetical protein HY934_04830 [Candidatus Firestonebacteria bacterium]|nr:hypothetical protein [Candidatus Firestonebacteria bacterium]